MTKLPSADPICGAAKIAAKLLTSMKPPVAIHSQAMTVTPAGRAIGAELMRLSRRASFGGDQAEQADELKPWTWRKRITSPGFQTAVLA
jgi:hypothetical protein